MVKSTPDARAHALVREAGEQRVVVTGFEVEDAQHGDKAPRRPSARRQQLQDINKMLMLHHTHLGIALACTRTPD